MRKFFVFVWLVSCIVLITLTISGIKNGDDGLMLFSRFVVWSIPNVLLFVLVFFVGKENSDTAPDRYCPVCHGKDCFIKMSRTSRGEREICRRCYYDIIYENKWRWWKLDFDEQLVSCEYKESNKRFVESGQWKTID